MYHAQTNVGARSGCAPPWLRSSSGGSQTIQVTITSEPIGQQFAISGNGCAQRAAGHRSPETFSWSRGAQCTVLWSSPAQVVNGRTTLHHWTDGSNANPRVFAGLTENAIFTGVFVPASLLTPYVQCRDPQ